MTSVILCFSLLGGASICKLVSPNNFLITDVVEKGSG